MLNADRGTVRGQGTVSGAQVSKATDSRIARSASEGSAGTTLPSDSRDASAVRSVDPVSADTMPDSTADDAQPGLSPEDAALMSQVLDKLYSPALDPSTLPELLDLWERMIAPQWHGPEGTAKGGLRGLLARSSLPRHIRQVEDLLLKAIGQSNRRAEDLALMPYRMTVALTLDRQMRVTGVSRAAHDRLGISRGVALSGLHLKREDLRAISRAAVELFRTRAADEPPLPSLIRARTEKDGQAVLVSLHLCRPDRHPPFVLMATTETHWTANALARLRDTLGLSQAELEVLTALAKNHSLAEIADLRGRSLNTVRTQVKSLLAKTETSSQSDLMRLALTSVPISAPDAPLDTAAMISGRVARAGLELPELPFQVLYRPNGRSVDFLEFGDPNGRPVIYFCANFGMCRWPADGEFTAGQTGLRVIVPIRPGYGGSTPLPLGIDRAQAVAEDVIALMDRLDIPAAHCLVLDEDMPFAARLHAIAPDRVLGVLGCGASLPFLRDAQYQRMGRWHRFVLGTARFAPQFLSFASRAGFAMARQLGKAEFVRLIYSGSPSDVATTRSPRIFDALECGTEILMGEGVDASDAYIEDTRVFHVTDWHQEFRAMADSVQVVAMIGSDDQAVAPETVGEYRVDFPQVRIIMVQNAGIFLLFQHCFEVLRQLEELMHLTKA